MTIKARIQAAVDKEILLEILSLNRKLKRARQQRDEWKARCDELRGHVTRYQKALAEERTKKPVHV